MKINETIHKLRLEKGLTQEQLAGQLGVSTPAVSKWEKAVSYPDITILPALARLLGTDLNTLLSFREELTDAEITDFLNSLAENFQKNGLQHAFSLAFEKIREYPSCDQLLYQSALLLEGLLALNAGPSPDPAIRFEIETLFERAAQSADPKISREARFLLISRYMERKEFGKAEALLKELPETASTHFDKQHFEALLYLNQGKTKEAARLTEQRLLNTTNTIQSCLVLLMETALKENRTRDAEKIAEISGETARLYGLWEFGVYTARLQLALFHKDTENALSFLSRMLSSAVEGWNMGQSVLYRYTAGNNNLRCTRTLMLPRLLKDLEDPAVHDYDFLRGNPDFQKLIDKFKALVPPPDVPDRVQ